MQNWESMVLRHAPLVMFKVETEMVSLRYTHCERSYLVQNVELW